jgi:hypothetical protein
MNEKQKDPWIAPKPGQTFKSYKYLFNNKQMRFTLTCTSVGQRRPIWLTMTKKVLQHLARQTGKKLVQSPVATKMLKATC